MGAVTSIGEQKVFVAAVAAGFAALGLSIALLLPPVYTARTLLLPPQQGGSGSSALASLGALAASVGISSPIKTPEEFYVGLLRSQSISDALIRKFDLQKRYEEKTLVATRLALQQRSRISSDRKSGLIVVDVDDTEADFAARLANAHVDEVRSLLTRISVSDAQQRRQFYESQIRQAKEDLSKAELDVARSQETSGLISVDSQSQTAISAAAQVRTQILAKEVQLNALRASAGPQNAELRRLSAELDGLRAQLSRLEGGASTSRLKAGTADALANVRKYRELKYQEAVYGALLQQYQLAKAEEARDAPLIQQVDVAVAPDRKSKPSRAVIVLFFLALGLVIGVVIAVIRAWMAHMNQDLAWAKRAGLLRRAWLPSRFRHEPPQ